ncbi:MAG: serine hydrolase [Actinomycetota bacterium]
MKSRAVLFVLVIALTSLGTAQADPPTACSDPGTAWGTSTPEAVGLDSAKLQDAIDFATSRDSWWFKVIRHGCLVGQERYGPYADKGRWESFSMAKSVTAMLTGRAITMGLLDLDDTVGEYLTEAPYIADEAHGAIKVSDMLTMTSGLHWNFLRDYNAFTMPDRVADALSLHVDYAPGTHYEYHQSSVSLLAKVVEKAVEVDLQEFAQTELFDKIGIPSGRWTWERDLAGNTAGFYGLRMEPLDFARLGELMLREGNWNGEQVITEQFVDEAQSESPMNKGYGYLFWLNGGVPYTTATVYARDERSTPQIASAPTDMYMMDGLFEQRVYIMPGLDMVVVRLGMQGSREADTRSSVWTSASGEFEHELFRKLMAAVDEGDAPADPGPYDQTQNPIPQTDPNEDGATNSLTHPEDWVFGAHGIQNPA